MSWSVSYQGPVSDARGALNPQFESARQYVVEPHENSSITLAQATVENQLIWYLEKSPDSKIAVAATGSAVIYDPPGPFKNTMQVNIAVAPVYEEPAELLAAA